MKHSRFDSDDWREIVAWLGGAAALESSAREHKAFHRARGVRTATDLLRLAFMYGPGGQSLRRLASAASADGVADVSDVALLNRLKTSADWLQALCARHLAGVRADAEAQASSQALSKEHLSKEHLSKEHLSKEHLSKEHLSKEHLSQAQALSKELPGPFVEPRAPPPCVRIVDGSRLNGPGQRAWRLHLCYDPIGGRVMDAVITTLAEGERLDRLAIRAGEIQLADRGFPQPDGIRNAREAGADILVRVTWNSLRLSDPAGHPLDWMALFQTASDQGALDIPVQVHKKSRGVFEPIATRLVMIPKPPEAAARARGAAQKASRKDGRTRTDPRTLAGADHLILLTSLPTATFSVEGLAGLYRVRWQIELAFKRMKSILHIDRLPAKDAGLARAWLHAHLLFALIVESLHAAPGAFPP